MLDRDDGDVGHAGDEPLEVAGVASQERESRPQRFGQVNNVGVDGVVALGSSEQLARCTTKPWRDGQLVGSSKCSMDAGIARAREASRSP